MKFFRIFSLVVFSLLSGLVLAWFFWRDISSESGALKSGESWAVLAFDEDADDRLIGEILVSGGYEIFHSESSQFVYIDDFGRLKEAPLDSFKEFLEPYDPRNDGYAEKLKSLFVREGKRYFFVPLETGGFQGAGIRKKLEYVLADFPFEMELLGAKKNPTIGLIPGGTALFAAFLLSRDKRRLVWQLPVLFAFAWTGVEGLVLAGLLTGLRALLPDLWNEFFPHGESTAKTAVNKRQGIKSGALRSYRLHFLFVFLFLLLFGLVSVLGSISLPAAGLGFVLFFTLELWGLYSERKRMKRIRFAAVWMLPQKAKIPVFRLPLIPFAAAAVFLLFIPVFFPDFSVSPGEPPFFVDDYVTLDDYEDHLAFQLSFSQKPLGRSGGPELEYYLAADGLIAAVPEPSKPAQAMPPFPLETFRVFLVEYGKGIKTVSFLPMEWISVLLLFALCVSNFYRQGNGYGGKKKAAFFWDRRAAA